jgi:hypothetical protein
MKEIDHVMPYIGIIYLFSLNDMNLITRMMTTVNSVEINGSGVNHTKTALLSA